MRGLALLVLALAACVLWPVSQDHPDAVADPNEGTCQITGTVSRRGSPVEADIRVYLRMPVIAHSRNVQRRYVAVERRMLARPGHREPTAIAVAGPDGRFGLKGLKPGRYDVVATGAEAATGGVHVPLFAPGQVQEISIGLRPSTESLSGTIRTKDGLPYVGTVVAFQGKYLWLDSDNVQAMRERVVQTNAEGEFKLSGLAPERTTIAVLRPGNLWLPLTRVHASSKAPLTLELDESATRYAGQIVDAASGKPIPNARVYWSAFGIEYPVGSTSTDDQGRFRIGHAARVRSVHEVYVLASGYGCYRWDWGPYDRLPPPTIPIRVGASVKGRVTDTNGSPVAGITVRIKCRNASKRTGSCPPATTDADGRYEMTDLPWGHVHIYARGNGWVPAGFSARSWFETHVEGAAPDPSTWTLVPGKTLTADHRVGRGVIVSGSVREPDGTPVVGAPITIKTKSGDPDYRWNGYSVAPEVATDKDGRFTISGLLPHGRYVFSAKVGGYAKAKSGEVSIGHRRQVEVGLAAKPLPGRSAPGSSGTPPRGITFTKPHWVLLTVLDAVSGKPIPGADIHAMINMAPAGGSSRHELTWTTDSEGKARLGPLSPQTGDVGIDAEGYFGGGPIPFGKPTKEGKPLTVRLKRTLIIRGTVLLPNGRPAPGGEVTLIELEGSKLERVRDISKEGKFIAWRLHDVRYALHAQFADDNQDYEAKAEAKGGGKDVVLRLKPVPGSAVRRRQPKLIIKVVGPDDLPIPFATIRLSGAFLPEKLAGGERIVDPAPRGEGTLEVWDARALDGYPMDLAPVRMDLRRTTGAIIVRMAPGTPIVGRLVGPKGEAVPRARIVARPLRHVSSQPGVFQVQHGATRSEPDGSFRIGTLAQEPYVLEILPPVGYAVPLRNPRVSPSSSPIELRLRKTVNATIQVRDSSGKPIARAEVEVRLPGWTFYRRRGWVLEAKRYGYATTDEAGVARLGNLDPDLRYTLSVKFPEGKGSLADLEDSDWRPRDQEVALARTGTLRGRVSYAPGMDKSDVHVHYAGPDGVWQSTWVSDGGTFKVTDVPLGSYRLAVVPGYQTRPESSTEFVKAKTGATEVHLRASPGATLDFRIEGTTPGSDSGPDEVLLIPEREGDRGAVHAAYPDSPELAKVSGLTQGCSYSLWVAPFGKGARTAWITGVRPSDKTLRVVPKPAKSIRVSVVSDQAPSSIEVRAYGPHPRMEVRPKESEDQFEYEIPGLVDMEWRIVVRAVVGRQWVTREARARPGQAVKIDLGAP